MATSFCDGICPIVRNAALGLHFPEKPSATALVCATLFRFCERKWQAGFFSVATLTVVGSPRCCALLNLSLCLDCCCFPILYIRHASRSNSEFSICPICVV